MATEYISREAVLALKHPIGAYGMDIESKAVEQIPVSDVRPVVHGHYVGEYDGYADGNPVYDMWYCSECGCCFEDWDEKPTYNFCPNCGADMRPCAG